MFSISKQGAPVKIGEGLRKLRMANSLTQEELASRADLTKGYISQLENDGTSPAINTLRDILEVLGVSISEFFAETPEMQVVFGKDSLVIANDGNGIRVELLVPGAQNRTMDPALVTLQPGEKMDEQSFHEGEEFGFVLAGRIGLTLDDKDYVVRKNECFFFTSDRRHAVRNAGRVPAKILWVVTPPTFDYKGK
jgi:transcriptional regulator with XRE-family HTH domain